MYVSIYISKTSCDQEIVEEIEIPILYRKQGINRFIIEKLITCLCIRIATWSKSVCQVKPSQAKPSRVKPSHGDPRRHES